MDALVLCDEGSRWLRMTSPVAVLTADSRATVPDAIREAEAAARRGAYAVGYVTYEAGTAFGLPVHTRPDERPLACFALYDLANVREVDVAAERAAPHAVTPPIPSWDWPAYAACFARVRDHLAAGDCYQVNATFELRAAFTGDPYGLFLDLARRQRGRYAAYLHSDETSVCSASPELFFSRRGTRLLTRPMKGTARRGRTLDEDLAAADRLRTSTKERAENVMVVDMMRNDLGRIARTGSVDVPSLFAVERYPTVWQMTSAVTADSDAPLPDVFAALFPSASITGAPKVRTMEIIKAIEGRPRGIYTGAIGYIAPGGDAQFNVAIRTAVVDARAGALTFGVGSGIVWDSEPEAEYRECLLKGAVLHVPDVPFELLETLKWTRDGGYALVAEHRSRLKGSAAYFQYPLDAGEVDRALERVVAGAAASRRVRLLVDGTGRVRAECFDLEADTPAVQACLATAPVDSSDVFLFHKTTHRAAYEAHRCPRCEDVLLWNERGELTETIVANVILELDGRLYTPPVRSGLLAGTLRARLIAEGRIRERVMTLADLERATRVWTINSVRGWREVALQDHRNDSVAAPALEKA
jgi:para-aminobenzoate synthetase/4-amino-4-deoxychorismate lyase